MTTLTKTLGERRALKRVKKNDDRKEKSICQKKMSRHLFIFSLLLHKKRKETFLEREGEEEEEEDKEEYKEDHHRKGREREACGVAVVVVVVVGARCLFLSFILCYVEEESLDHAFFSDE